MLIPVIACHFTLESRYLGLRKTVMLGSDIWSSLCSIAGDIIVVVIVYLFSASVALRGS